jgi:serine protease Do
VVLDAKGHILTNSHVVSKASKVTVTFASGEEVEADVVGHDPNTDVAVLRLERLPAQITAARLGDSNQIEVGEWVVAIGSPLGMDQSVTAGIVSGKGKVGRNMHMGSADRVRSYIQTDAKINPGNSGGPLVNLNGEVIGINMMINAGPGGAYGFSIPINIAKRVAESLLKEGRMAHAYMGVHVGDVKDKLLIREGRPDPSLGPSPKNVPDRAAWVVGVAPGSPAQKAGVQVGDIIVQIDQAKIAAAADVVDYVSSRSVGNQVTLAYVRDGKRGLLKLTLADLNVAQGVDTDPKVASVAGLSLQSLTPEMIGFLGVNPGTQGAVVADVKPQSRAARAGLREGDVIVEVDRRPVTGGAQASEQLRRPGGHLLRIHRSSGARFLTLPAK